MPIKNKNISEKAYKHLRESMLLSGVYVGQKIPHQELGQKLGISHTPLREALFRLVAEGLLTHENYKGFSVPAITVGEAEDIYEAREVIEPYLAQKAAKTITPATIEKIQNILKKYKELMSEPYKRKRILTDKTFHLAIAGLAGNATLFNVLNQIYDKLIFKSPVERIALSRIEEAIQEHHEILDMLKAKDGNKVATRMRRHIRKQRDYVINNIINKENGAPPLNPLF